MECEDFLKSLVRRVKTDKLKRYLAAAMFKLCGGTMTQLSSKALSMRYIPENYYQ